MAMDGPRLSLPILTQQAHGSTGEKQLNSDGFPTVGAMQKIFNQLVVADKNVAQLLQSLRCPATQKYTGRPNIDFLTSSTIYQTTFKAMPKT